VAGEPPGADRCLAEPGRLQHQARLGQRLCRPAPARRPPAEFPPPRREACAPGPFPLAPAGVGTQ